MVNHLILRLDQDDKTHLVPASIPFAVFVVVVVVVVFNLYAKIKFSLQNIIANNCDNLSVF